MTDIQQYQPRNEVALTTSQDVAVHRLGEWAQSASAAHNIAQTLVQTSFVPDSFKNKPGEATAAILAGLEVGLQPMAALRSFDVIQGQAAPRAITLRAIIQSHGHEIILEESNAARCKMRGKRKGSSEWVNVVWTMDRAKAAGLTNKTNWKNQPQAMLVARATSELARLIAADAILGIAYSAEEIADGGADAGAPAEVAAPTATGTRKMSRPKKDEPEPEPEAAPEEATDVEPITPAQLKKLHTMLTKVGITDRDEGLAYYASVVDHDVESSKDLTKAEAVRVIDALERIEQEPAADQETGEIYDAEVLPDPTTEPGWGEES